MKSIKRIIAVVIACVAIAAPASAQFSFGIKAGLNVDDMKFNNDILTDIYDNHVGWNVGVMAEFSLPILGLGVDASLLYANRNVDFAEKNLSYIDLPINLKWKINIPAVAKVVKPYIATGPSFSFLANKDAIVEAWESQAVDVDWNVGIGVELFSHLQIGASYGWGLTNTIKTAEKYTGTDFGTGLINLEGKSNCWTISAAYLF